MNSEKKNWWNRCLTAPLIIVATLLIWIQETLWEWLKWMTDRIALLAWVQWLEGLIRRLSPYATVVVFFLPLTLLVPFKLIAVYWLVRGYWYASLATLIAAKVLGTAIEARMFVVCKPKLMTIPWFKWVHDVVLQFRDRLYAALHAMPFYQSVRAKLIAIKLLCKQFLRKIRIRLRSIRSWYHRNKSL